MVALVHRPLQHLLQRQPGLYRGLARERKRQQRQLHGNHSAIYRGQQSQPRAGQRQLRQSHRKVGESHKTAQHKAQAHMEQKPAQDRQRHRMAQPKGIQPLPVEGMAANGQVAIPERRVRRSRRNVLIHVAPVRHTAADKRHSKGVARQMLHRARMALRRRRRDNEDEARHHALQGRERVGLHLCRLLHTEQAIRRGREIPCQGHQARTAQEAESPRVVSDGTAADPARQQAGGIQGLRQGGEAEPALRSGVQRPHSPDRGHGRGPFEANDKAAAPNGQVGQEQRLPRPGVLRHRQHLPGRARHAERHLGV